MSSTSSTEDDLLTLMFMVFGGMATGAFSLGVLFNPIREWMVTHQLLAQGEAVVIPFVDGVGFGWAQILVVLGLLAGVIALGVVIHRRVRDRV